jgi:hypothetical protein
MVAVQGYGALPAAAAVPLPPIAVLSGTEQTSLVVDLGAGTEPVDSKTAMITVDGAPQQAQLAPVVSDRLAVVFVIDTSVAGGAALPAWLSAAARFILEAPTGTQAAVVADTSPPTLISPPQSGPMGIVRALSGVRAGGQRSTSDALTLAKDQFPASPPGRRVVLVYTSAADAGGESAAALGDRFRRAGTILIVVGSVADSPYWSDATRVTGGFFAPAGTPVVVPALDQVATSLRGRYLVQFPTPRALPARVSVRIDTGNLVLTGDVVIPADSAGDGRQGSRFRIEVALATIVGCLMVFIAVVLMIRRRSAHLPAGRRRARRSRRRRPWYQRVRDQGPHDADSGSTARDETTSTAVREGTAVPRTVFRGRASVPGLARGRDAVPGDARSRSPSSSPWSPFIAGD